MSAFIDSNGLRIADNSLLMDFNSMICVENLRIMTDLDMEDIGDVEIDLDDVGHLLIHSDVLLLRQMTTNKLVSFFKRMGK